MKLTFERDPDTRWYVKLPKYIEAGGDREDLEMVMGADIILDRFAKEDSNEVSLEISLDGLEYSNSFSKVPMDTPSGAYYIWTENGRARLIVWLCDVTAWVFGGQFPETIYFNIV